MTRSDRDARGVTLSVAQAGYPQPSRPGAKAALIPMLGHPRVVAGLNEMRPSVTPAKRQTPASQMEIRMEPIIRR